MSGPPEIRWLPDRTYGPSTAWRRMWQCRDGMAHPAKMNVDLCRDLFLRYTKPGQTIIDPFGGAGTSMVGCLLGRNVLLVELEARFVEWLDLSWDRLRKRHRALTRGAGGAIPVRLPPLGHAEIVQGDSRRLPLPDAACDVAETSPPYVDARQGWPTPEGAENVRYGATPGQIGGLNHGEPGGFLREVVAENAENAGVHGALTSAPFGDMNAKHAGGDVGGLRPAKDGAGFEGEGDKLNFLYSHSDDNIGNLPHEPSGVVTSPPYEHTIDRLEGNWAEKKAARLRALGRHEDADRLLRKNATAGSALRQEQYGHSAGQIGNLRDAPAAAVTSPPFAASVPEHSDEKGRRGDDARLRVKKDCVAYGDTPGQIGALALGDVAGAVCSPPYADVASRNRSAEPYAREHPEYAKDYGRSAVDANRSIDGYGASAGQIGGLPHAAITSPPYERAITQGGQTGAWQDKYGYQGNNDGYSRSGENIGNLPSSPDDDGEGAGYHEAMARDLAPELFAESEPAPARPESYSDAMLTCYREMFRVVRPGGVLVTVVGNYVRGGKEVRLDEDTIALCVAAGWTPWERWKHVKRTVSFWRHLHRQKALRDGKTAAPDIEEEHVLVFVRGDRPGWQFQDLPPTEPPRRRAVRQMEMEL